MLDTCSSCRGFVPSSSAACPHCDAPIARPSRARAALGAAAALAMSVTLMACYGGYGEPYEPYACDLPPPITLGVPVTGDTTYGASQTETGTCVGAGKELAYAYQADTATAGQPGTFTITWTTNAPLGVYVRGSCDLDSAEMACGDGVASRELSFHVDAAGAFTVFVDGRVPQLDGGLSMDGPFTFTVTFKPDFVCGDGILGGPEECDDGNLLNGDGCDQGCHVETCKVAVPLSAGVTMGDTSMEDNAIHSPCNPVFGPEAFYVFTPTEHGELTFTLDSPVGLTLYLISDCEHRFGLTCDPDAGPLSVDASPGVPVYVAVSGTTDLTAGPFDLTTDFKASCGDGTVDAWEGCDDGNRTPGDGCDADCKVELDTYCAAATTLVIGDNVGDTTGGSSVFSAPCAGTGAPERLYTFTAPSKGVLVLDLAAAADLGVYVLSTCTGVPASCTNTAHTGGTELVSLTVQSGESSFIVVDGSTSADEGPFTLNAQFVPAP